VKTSKVIYRHLLDYLKGKLSNKERYDLEKEALEDPFLEEAMEGFERLNAASIAQDIELLKVKLNLKTQKKKKRIPVFYYPIAASVLILIGLSFLWIGNQKNTETPVETVVIEIETGKDTFIDRSQESEILSDVAFEEIEEELVEISKNKKVTPKSSLKANTEVKETIPKKIPDFTEVEAKAIREEPEIAKATSHTIGSVAVKETNKEELINAVTIEQALEDKVAGVAIERRKEKLSKKSKVLKQKKVDTSKVFSTAEVSIPSIPFNGTRKNFKSWIKEQFDQKYRDIKISAKAKIKFTIGNDGSLYHIDIITSLERKQKKTLKNILKSSPNWKPAKLYTKTVAERVEIIMEF